MGSKSDMLPKPSQSPPVWHAPAPDRLRTEPLDSLTALYDRASGQTHLLAPPMPEILASLAGSPATGPELLTRLAASFDLSAEGDAAAIIDARLHELAALGLVERR